MTQDSYTLDQLHRDIDQTFVEIGYHWRKLDEFAEDLDEMLGSSVPDSVESSQGSTSRENGEEENAI